jgi:hypothetical protein
MIAALRNLFAAATEPTASPGDVDAARSKLAEAKVQRRQCIAELTEATQRVERVQQVIADAKTAAIELAAAEAQAAASSKAWAEAGALGKEPDGNAFTVAAEARTKAHRAELMAAGGKAALAALEDAASTAESAVKIADEKIRLAAVDILVAEAETDFAVLDEFMPRIAEAVLALRGLRAMSSSKFGGFHSGQSGDIASRLEALGFSAPTAANSDDGIDAAAAAWLRKARELAKE